MKLNKLICNVKKNTDKIILLKCLTSYHINKHCCLLNRKCMYVMLLQTLHYLCKITGCVCIYFNRWTKKCFLKRNRIPKEKSNLWRNIHAYCSTTDHVFIFGYLYAATASFELAICSVYTKNTANFTRKFNYKH